jgi:acyl carrier protein
MALAHEIEHGAFPLRGIFHFAGEGGRLPADQLGLDDLKRVCSAKVEGAWNLHEASQELRLDHFVLSSSIAATWGGKEQAHYAAANHFLDALAMWRRGQKLPSLSIAWGPWSGGGLADLKVQQELKRMGLFPMAPEAALGAMEELLAAGDIANAVVVHADWQRFPALFSALPRYGFFADVAPQAPVYSARSPVRGAVPIQDRLAKILAGLFGYPAGHRFNPNAGFADLGMDSVMSLELRKCLEKEFEFSVSATVAFDYPNMNRLTRYLNDALGSAALEAESNPNPLPVERDMIEVQIRDRLEELEDLLKSA